MHVRVKYDNDCCDYVPDFMLDVLISRRDIVAFYRPSERKWAIVGRDPMRSPTCEAASLLRRRRTDILL